MERTIRKQKKAVESLATIVYLMKSIYDDHERLKQYAEEYEVFAGVAVTADLMDSINKLKAVNQLLNKAATTMEEKVEQVLTGQAEFPEYRMVEIDNRIVIGETKNAYVLKMPEGIGQKNRIYFIPKSMTEVETDYRKKQFRYYENFTVAVRIDGSAEKEERKIPVKHLVQLVNQSNDYFAKADQKENLKQEVLRFYENNSIWTNDMPPEEWYKHPLIQECMNDLYHADNNDMEDLRSLIFLRKYIDPKVTVDELNLCSDFFNVSQFEDYASIPQMNETQQEFVRKMLREIRSGKTDLSDLTEAAEEVFGSSARSSDLTFSL